MCIIYKHHRLYGCEFEWTLGDGDGQGGLACCDSWGRKELEMTEWLNTPINLQVQGPVDYFLLGEGRRKEECAEEKTDAGRDWGQEKKGTTDDEMAGWHHWLDARESGWTPGVGDGQGGLACCNSCGGKESDTTEQLNWTELNWDPRQGTQPIIQLI